MNTVDMVATTGTSGVTYTSSFASGTVFEAFAAAVPTTANVLALFGTSGTFL